MKKSDLVRKSLILASALCLMAAAPVFAQAAEEPAVPAVSTTSPNGNAYCWQPAAIFYTENADRVLLDYYAYMLETPLVTTDGVTFISLNDLAMLYAPDFAVINEDGKLTLTHAGVSAEIALGETAATFYTGEGELEAAPYEEGGMIYVPIKSLLTQGFGKTYGERNGFFGLGNAPEFEVTSADVYNLKMFFRGKPVGKSYWAYYNEEVNRLESVIVYIPSTYDENVPNKMVVQLHGASGNSASIPDGANGPALMKAAEEYGYIFMWPEAYCRLCNFGMWVQPAGQLPITDETDPQNPAGHSPEKLEDIRLSGDNVQIAMDFVESKWNIDEKNVFIMGISMGGCGTWYQAATYPERFSAASPSGAFVEPEFFDWSTITIPTLYVGGTEDRNGFDLMLRAYDIAMSQGANIVDFIVVGGAPHGGEWPQVINETLDFFEGYLE